MSRANTLCICATRTGWAKSRRSISAIRPRFTTRPIWSPDSKKIAYRDKRLNLWYVDIEKGTPVKVDTDTYENPFVFMSPAWSPDSRWIAYTKQLKNHLRAVFIYSLETGKANQITDGMSDALYAAFDKNGKYLYFTASTDIGPTVGWLRYVELAASGDAQRLCGRPAQRSDLRRSRPKATKRKSNGQRRAKRKRGKPKTAARKARAARRSRLISTDIDQRILALPIPARNFVALVCRQSGNYLLARRHSGCDWATGAIAHTIRSREAQVRQGPGRCERF